MAGAKNRPKIALADDHQGILDYLSGLLGSNFDIVGSVSNGLEVPGLVDKTKPDLVVMDIGMPGMNGIQTARHLRKLGYLGKIIFLTVVQDEDYVSTAFAAGATGYVLKARMQSDLLPAIKEVLRGGSFVWNRSANAE
jgi:DNA-binding NarL/FixJ family response regulator